MSYRFDDVEIDAEAFRVTKAGAPVRLEPKAVELLLFLARNPGRLVTKAEIQETVWAGTFVTENALTRLVAQIRKGLGDDAKEPRYIQTVPTRGYRFVAALGRGREAPEALAPPPDGRGPRWRSTLGAATALLAVAFAGLALTRVGHPPSSGAGPTGDAAPPAVERQVSTSATLNAFPCFSPDGSALAYASLRKGSMEIVARALAPGATEVSVTADGMQNVQPAFSPHGRWIAYHSAGRGGIWLVPALGGVPRRLTPFGSNPAWSPDGSLIAFQGQSWVGLSDSSWTAGEGSTLWLVPSSGGEPRQLTTIEDVGPGGQGGPVWSPDGRLLAFISKMRVFTVRPDGSGLRRTSGKAWCREVVWEKGGRAQLWTGWQAGNWFVWRVPVAPDTGVPTGEPEILAGGGESASAWTTPALSADGRAVAYTTVRTRYSILAQKVSPDGRPFGEPASLVASVAGRKSPPLFSPDGRSLAFGTTRPGVGQSLWVANLETGEPRLLAEGAGPMWSRTWFPDGHRLAFVVDGAQGRSLRSVDVDTGDVREHRRLEPQISSSPILSPDGETLAAHGARGGGLDVWVMRLAGGPARPLTEDREGAGWPVWSPDGETLAVELMRAGDTRVGVLPASGGPVRELTSAPGQSWPFSFSPDGRRVAFAGQRGGVWNVYWVPVEGGEEQRVTSYTSPALYVRYPDWSPTGDRVAYEFAESTSTVWVRELPPSPADAGLVVPP